MNTTQKTLLSLLMLFFVASCGETIEQDVVGRYLATYAGVVEVIDVKKTTPMPTLTLDRVKTSNAEMENGSLSDRLGNIELHFMGSNLETQRMDQDDQDFGMSQWNGALVCCVSA